MTNEKLKRLLDELRGEIKTTDADTDTRASLRDLDAEIRALLDEEADDPDSDAMLDRARRLEATFASNHPTAERIMRELIDTLGKIGL
jgi:Domain of unknown function (DUF4404)